MCAIQYLCTFVLKCCDLAFTGAGLVTCRNHREAGVGVGVDIVILEVAGAEESLLGKGRNGRRSLSSNRIKEKE